MRKRSVDLLFESDDFEEAQRAEGVRPWDWRDDEDKERKDRQREEEREERERMEKEDRWFKEGIYIPHRNSSPLPSTLVLPSKRLRVSQ